MLPGYAGQADHRVTAAMVRATRLPVIANGDLRSAAQGKQLLEECGAAGLMLGRGALAGPLLFARLRGAAPETASRAERLVQLRGAIEAILARDHDLFCGEVQVLSRLKDVLLKMDAPLFHADLLPLRRVKTLPAFRRLLAEIG